MRSPPSLMRSPPSFCPLMMISQMDSLSERMDNSITLSQVQDLLYSTESEIKEIMGNELAGVARVQSHQSQVGACMEGRKERVEGLM
jgi:hypothetical protein